MKDNVRKEARKNFNYTFAKDIDVAKYGAESARSQIVDLLEKVEKDNNVKISGLLKLQLVNAMKKPNSKNFDGSLEHTIDLMADAFEASFNSKVKKFPNKQEVSKEVAKDIKTILKEVVSNYKTISMNKGIEFRSNIEHNIPDMLYGDGIELKKVLTLLLNESIKNHPHGDRTRNSALRGRRLNQFDQRAITYK